MTSESIPPVVRPHHPPAVTLAEVARHAEARFGSADGSVVVTGIAVSTQSVQPGDLFVALPGARG
ncbi:MAG: UDP-N-acetylmuramoyl-L-alanyl-D-glutamate--2,6-diaminopimelate ligase, partial [Cryobacterium sp.]